MARALLSPISINGDMKRRDASNKPTECPYRLGRVFRLAPPNLGIFESPRAIWRNRKESKFHAYRRGNQANRMPTKARVLFSAWEPRAWAFLNHRKGRCK